MGLCFQLAGHGYGAAKCAARIEKLRGGLQPEWRGDRVVKRNSPCQGCLSNFGKEPMCNLSALLMEILFEVFVRIQASKNPFSESSFAGVERGVFVQSWHSSSFQIGEDDMIDVFPNIRFFSQLTRRSSKGTREFQP